MNFLSAFCWFVKEMGFYDTLSVVGSGKKNRTLKEFRAWFIDDNKKPQSRSIRLIIPFMMYESTNPDHCQRFNETLEWEFFQCMHPSDMGLY